MNDVIVPFDRLFNDVEFSEYLIEDNHIMLINDMGVSGLFELKNPQPVNIDNYQGNVYVLDSIFTIFLGTVNDYEDQCLVLFI